METAKTIEKGDISKGKREVMHVLCLKNVVGTFLF